MAASWHFDINASKQWMLKGKINKSPIFAFRRAEADRHGEARNYLQA